MNKEVMNADDKYFHLSRKILSDSDSVYKPNRTGVDSISRFGNQLEFNLEEGLPLLTTKRVFWKGIVHELVWFLSGDSNIKYLVDNNVHFWDGNAFQGYLRREKLDKKIPMYTVEWYAERDAFAQRIKEDDEFARVHGDLGPVYGKQWRHWKTTDGKEIDQIQDAINLLKKSPSSRRIIVSAWNPEEVPNMVLPPCHSLFHFNVADDKLDCLLYQRSCDTFLGVPFNMASYGLLTLMMAREVGLKPGRFIHTFGDTHFYSGMDERGKFYQRNLNELKTRLKSGEPYLDIKDWIDKNAPAEKEGLDGMDHVTAILEQFSRDTKTYPSPVLEIANKPLLELKAGDFKIDYKSHPDIKRRMAV